MLTILARNVNEALPIAMMHLKESGIKRDSRNGPVIEYPGPVVTEYKCPEERVLFSPERDANPFFHLMEALWMLGGRNDVAFPARFAKQIRDYSDDGETLHGAYGYRWRRHFEEPLPSESKSFDQLPLIITELKRHPENRRLVLTMWDPVKDLCEEGLDFPCNTHVYFRFVDDYRGLQMTVCCRSNDVLWGAYGANAVHFSMLHEYVSALSGLPMGRMFQLSNSFHVYTEFGPWERCKDLLPTSCPYDQGSAIHELIVEEPKTWDRDLKLFFEAPYSNGFDNPFFHRCAKPMYAAHAAWRKKKDPDRYTTAREILTQTKGYEDWIRAGLEWLDRREAA